MNKKTIIKPMRKVGIILIVVAVFLVSCGEGKVASRAGSYLNFIGSGNLEEAYELVSPRLRKNISFDLFTEYTRNPEDNTSVSESGMKFSVVDAVISRDKLTASAHGKLSMQGQTQTFRLPMIFDEGGWWVDNVVIEHESPEFPGHYVSGGLREVVIEFFDWILDGETVILWEHSSDRIHEEMTIAEYSNLAIATVSGLTPREEEYTIMVGPAFTSDPDFESGEEKRTGFVFATVVLGDPETSESKAIVKADFVFEDSVWKADFAQLEEVDESLLQKIER